MFKDAKWIFDSKQYSKNSYGWFFKYVDVSEPIIESIINISAHNHFKLIINGETISGLVTPAPSVINKEKLYLSYDLKNHLKLGSNKIEVIVLYLGGGGQNYLNGTPGFICQGFVKTKNTCIPIISDENFLNYTKTPLTNDMPFQQSRRITPVQYYDNTIELEEQNQAISVALKGYNNYVLQEIPEGGVHKTIKPTLCFQEDEIKVYDCMEIISGFVSVEIKPTTDETITIRYSEDLENNRVKHNVANEHSEYYKDIFVVKKNQTITLKADFTYKAFRYFEVVSKTSNIRVTAYKAGTRINLLGDLYSNSNKEINQLFTMFDNTQKNNILGLLVDCPHREQAQYLGDSALQAESIIYNVAERKSLLDKVITDFAHSQYEDGTFPFVAPGTTDGDEFGLKIPEYDLYFIELIYKRYLIDFDRSIIEKNKLNITRLIDQYINKIDHTGLVRKNSDWHISDWPYPSVDESGDYLAFENMLLYKSLQMLSVMKANKPYQEQYDSVMKFLRKSIIKHFKANRLFKDSENSLNAHQGIQAYALSCGLFETSEVDYALRYIIDQKVASSIILSRTVLEVLFKYHKIDEALSYIFDFEKGWGNVIRNNSLTMWEGFDDIESHSHAWGLYPIKYIQAYVLGIKFDETVKNKVLINPRPTKRINDLSGSVVTEMGVLSFSYTIIKDEISFSFDIPSGLQVEFVYYDTKQILAGKGNFKLETQC